MESDHEASVAHGGNGSSTDRVSRHVRDRNRYAPADTWQNEPRDIIAERFGIDTLNRSEDSLTKVSKRKVEATRSQATTNRSRSTAHSRSPPVSVTTNDSEIAAPKSSSHIPDWK